MRHLPIPKRRHDQENDLEQSSSRNIHGGAEGYRPSRPVMEKRGNQADGTHACHGFSKHQFKTMVKEYHGEWSPEDIENARRFVGSKENLRIQPSEHNLHHSHLEREMREARNNSTRLGSVAFRRVVDTQVKKVVDAVYDGRLNQANGSRFLSYLNCYKNSQGETALEVYRNDFDMLMINEATTDFIQCRLEPRRDPVPSLHR